MRWSFGYPWILKYLNTRYARTLLHDKLLDYVDDFPSFYNAIKCFFQKYLIHHFTGNTSKEHNGLKFLPFSIFGFIDCLIDCVSRPFLGPGEDYVGAPGKAMHEAAQRLVYTGFKKWHGIKVETISVAQQHQYCFWPNFCLDT